MSQFSDAFDAANTEENIIFGQLNISMYGTIDIIILIEEMDIQRLFNRI